MVNSRSPTRLLTKSIIVTMPITSLSSQTGRCRIPWLVISASASSTVLFGLPTMTLVRPPSATPELH